jgi:hypothetical protein
MGYREGTDPLKQAGGPRRPRLVYRKVGTGRIST